MTPRLVGVDLGGNTIHAALAGAGGEIHARKTIATEAGSGPEHVLDRIVALVDGLCRESDVDRDTLSGLGMGVPGLVDLRSGTTKFLPNLATQWRDVPVADILSKRLGVKTRLLNDARAATLGEWRFGHGADRRDVTMACFMLGTGVGGGVVIDGELRLGTLGAAGELGHQTIRPDGRLCGCGNRGCLETLAGASAIVAEGVRLIRNGMAPNLFDAIHGDIANLTVRIMAECAEADETVRRTLVDAADAIGIAAANVTAILHPDYIVLGGGVAEMGDLLFDVVRGVVRQRVGMFPVDDIQIVPSQLGDQAGVYGAIALAMQAMDV